MITTDDSIVRGLTVLQFIAAVLMFRQAQRTPSTRERDHDHDHDHDSSSNSAT